MWNTTESFESLARQFAEGAGLREIAEDDSVISRTVQNWGEKLGFRGMGRTPYDMFMLRFHDYLKENANFQASCPKNRLEFPPLATWIVFTDCVAHAVISGQYAIEQTLLIPPEAWWLRKWRRIEFWKASPGARSSVNKLGDIPQGLKPQ